MSQSVKIGLFVAACVAQLVLVGGGIVKHERALASGAPYRFELAPVDPVDPFRGRYVALGYAVERVEVPLPPELEPGAGGLVYVVLAKDGEGFARVRALSAERPLSGDFVRARVYFGASAGMGYVDLPFDRYYAPEAEARRIERVFGERRPTDRSYAVVRVLEGHGVIESLVLNEAAPEAR